MSQLLQTTLASTSYYNLSVTKFHPIRKPLRPPKSNQQRTLVNVKISIWLKPKTMAAFWSIRAPKYQLSVFLLILANNTSRDSPSRVDFWSCVTPRWSCSVGAIEGGISYLGNVTARWQSYLLCVRRPQKLQRKACKRIKLARAAKLGSTLGRSKKAPSSGIKAIS